MVARVQRAGIAVLVLTADVPIGSNREADARNGFGFPIRPTPRLALDVALHPRWTIGVLARTFLTRGYPHIVNLEPDGGPGLFSRAVAGIAAHEDLSWDHLQLMRELWKGPLVLKGVLSPADVARARDMGLDGVILSNHGGRQLDYAPSPLQVLPPALAAARGMPVMIDSGFRRGTDVIRWPAVPVRGRPRRRARCGARHRPAGQGARRRSGAARAAPRRRNHARGAAGRRRCRGGGLGDLGTC
jgi:L-lactate dehydrogenase (cytochrome)